MIRDLVALPHPGHLLIAPRMFKVPVRVEVCDSRLCATIYDQTVIVIARNNVEAADWMRDKLRHIPETTITAYGPKGGKVRRYIGWHSAIAAHLFDELPQQIEEALENL